MIDIQKSTAYHPAIQILFLLLSAIVGAVVFTILGFIIYYLYSKESINVVELAQNNLINADINFLRIIQISSSIGIFVASSIVYSYIIECKPQKYLYLSNPINATLLGLTILIMLCSSPLLEWVAIINQKMSLPLFLKDAEIWMKAKELEAAKLTKKLLEMKTASDLAINLLMVAIIPAIGEELFFRGGMQNAIGQWFKNKHIAIWLTAIIFSAIHVQFYGFFPRMLLGALFGYLLIYGGSIWYAILGHFLNNGIAVVMAYIMQKQGKSLNEIDQNASFNIYAYLISTIITLALLYLFFKQTKIKNSDKIYE